MKRSLHGHWLPESARDAEELGETRNLTFHYCVFCGRSLADPSAAATVLGWRETQISGTCEPCFDGLFAEENIKGE